MSARKAKQPRSRATGRFREGSPVPEPHAPLLDVLRFVARASVRRVYNCPRTTVHVERCVLHWLMRWDPVADLPVRQYIGLKAANEARKAKALKGREQDVLFGRSHDLVRLVARQRSGAYSLTDTE